MSEYVELAGGRDIYGRPWEVGTRGGVMVVRFGEAIRVFDGDPDDIEGGAADRDRFAAAIGRAAMPGQAGAGKSALESAATLTARAFPIYARFAHPDNGYKGDQEQAAKYLVPGRTYLIDHMDVGRSHTTIWLHDFRDVGFNSVLFAAGTEDEWAATQDEPETAPEPGQHACCEHCEHFGDENTDDHREPCPEGCND